MVKIAGRNDELDRKFESREYDFDLREKPGILKFNNGSSWIPVKATVNLQTGVGAELKPCPSVDPKNGKVLPGVVDDSLSWAEIIRSVNFVGLAMADPKADKCKKTQFGFWMIPQYQSIKEFVPELDTDKNGPMAVDQLLSIAAQNCPYVTIWNRFKHIRGSMDGADAPDEWVAMTDDQFWVNWIVKKELGVANPKDYWLLGCPLPEPEPHLVMRCYLLKEPTGKEVSNFEDETYSDGRSGGSVHPCIAEFGKSSTNHFVQMLESGEVTGEMGEVGNGTMFRLKKRKPKKNEMNSNAFEVAVENRAEPEITPKEVLNEWAPLRYPEELKGSQREPILNIMTVENQIEILERALGPEVVDYGLKGSVYYELLSEDVKGSFDKMVKKGYNWMEVTKDRLLDSATLRTEDQNPGVEDRGAPETSKAVPHLTGSNVSNPAEDQDEDEKYKENPPVDKNYEEPVDEEVDDDDEFLRELEEEEDGDGGNQSAENLIGDDEMPF